MNCYRCDVPMVEGVAMKEIYTGSPDFLGDIGGERGCTMSPSGRSNMVNVMKCPECGHSFQTDNCALAE